MISSLFLILMHGVQTIYDVEQPSVGMPESGSFQQEDLHDTHDCPRSFRLDILERQHRETEELQHQRAVQGSAGLVPISETVWGGLTQVHHSEHLLGVFWHVRDAAVQPDQKSGQGNQ